jgi:5-methylcytosine-specific restriction endonuclease McrA
MKISKIKKHKKRNPLKTWRNKLDIIYSKLIRKRGYCQRCGKSENLQCSHIHSREKMSVRWDLLNSFCLCAGCHKYFWHTHPIDAAEFAKNKLGDYEYTLLIIKANSIKKWKLDELQSLYSTLERLYNNELA